MTTIRNRVRNLGLAFALAAAVTTGVARDFGPDQPYDKLTSDLVTPHTPFARPFAGGRLRALVIAPTWTQRETVELAQRLDLDYVPLMTESYDHFGRYPGGGEREYYLTITAEQFAAVVDERLAPAAAYDLIIIGKIPWKVFPAPVQVQILERVRQGTGLLYVCPADLPADLAQALQSDEAVRAVVLAGVPWRALPLLKDLDPAALVRTGVLGKGHVAAVDYAQKTDDKQAGRLECLTPFLSDDPLYYDYYLSLVARACLWAGGKTLAPVVAGLPAAPRVIPQEKLPGEAVSLRLEGTPAPATVETVVRNRANAIEWQQRGVPAAGAEFATALPFLSAGEKILDLRLLDTDGKVLNWASVPLVVEARFRLRELRLASDVLARGAALTGTVLCEGGPVPDGATVALEALDSHGRLVGAQTLPVRALEQPFRLELAGVLVRGHTLQARLLQQNRVLAAAETRFWVNLTDVDDLCRDFSFIMWGGARDQSRATATYLEQLRQAGVNILYVTSALWDAPAKSDEIGRRVASADLLAAPYATRLWLATPTGPEHVRPVEGKDGPEVRNCPLSLTPAEQAADPVQKHLTELGRAYGPLGAAYYSLGDENALAFAHVDVCFCAKCQEGFRQYLRELYPSVAAVNHEWGTEYRDWAEIKPITLKDAQKLNRYPQWIDHRLFMDRAFARLHHACGRTLTAADPQARVGMEGPIYPGRSGTGFNFYEMLPEMHFFGPYPGALEIHAATSFLPPGSLATVWFGSYEGDTFAAKMRGMPWKMLCEGMNAVAWWPAGVEGSSGLGGAAALRPDYLPLAHFAEAAGQVREIQSGIGRLLLTGTRVVPPLGIYFSNACLHAATIRPKETLWENSLQDFNDVLHDAGYEYRYVSPPEVLAGKLHEFKALILPYSQAISAREVAALGEFVQGGGVLLADFVPGIMDEHGKLLPESALKAVFGEFTRLHVQANGKGKAVCLADYVKGYSDKRKAGDAAGVAAGFARLLRDLAGVAPAAGLADADGRPRQDIACARFQHGTGAYLLVVRDFLSKASASPTVQVVLPATSQVYEVRAARDLGEAERVTLELAPGDARLLALLPAKVGGVRLKVARQTLRPGDQVRLQLAATPAALQGTGLGVRLEVAGPGAKALPWYAETLILADGEATALIPLARNEAPGEYSVVARELASGATARATFSIK